MESGRANKGVTLEVVSNGSRLRSLERRSLPRLSLGSEQFRLSTNNRIFSVSDISEKGMGLWIADGIDIHLFTVGMEIEGTLNLKREKYAVKAKVRNIARDRVGCEFEELSTQVKVALSQLLDPALLGAEMKPIPSPGIHTLWYHAPSGTDLVFHRLPDGQFDRLTFYIFGYFIQWDQSEGVSTGRTHLSLDKKSELRGIMRLETLFLDPDAVPDVYKLGIAKTVILSSNLPQDLKSWCIRQFER